jgi:ADP-ribosylglycohydrolase
MLGAIIGDILGSVFEKIPNMELRKEMKATDDSWLTCACLDWCNELNIFKINNEFENYKFELINLASKKLRYWWSFEKDSGFSKRFSAWASNENAAQGVGRTNGSLMRQSPIIKFSIENNLTLEMCLDLCDIFASPTHHHEDTYPAIRSHAELIYKILKKEYDFKEVKTYILNSQYEILTVDYWKNQKSFIWDAPKSLSIVYCAIFNATDYKSFIDICIEIGGDVDTYCAIGGPIAQSLWGIPIEFEIVAKKVLKKNEIINSFLKKNNYID